MECGLEECGLEGKCNVLGLNQKKRGDCEWAPPIAIRSLLHLLKQRLISASRLEPENDTSVVPEVALVVIPLSEIIAEPGQHIIKLPRPNSDGFAQRDVNSSANDEVKSIVART